MERKGQQELPPPDPIPLVILVDTNVFVEILQDSPRGKEALRTLEGIDPKERLVYSALTWFELCVKPQQAEPARKLLGGFEAIPISPPIAEKAAEVFHKHLSGNRRHIPDAIIAATALSVGATLWTLNRSDFQRIPHLKLFGAKTHKFSAH